MIPVNKETLVQFIKFGIVGASNTVISYATYLVGLSFGLHYLIASVLGFILSVVNAFFWNNRYVFKAKGKKRSMVGAFVKTALSYAGTGLLLSNILLVIQVDFLRWPEQMAPLLNLLITIPLNFLLNKLWAFKSKE